MWLFMKTERFPVVEIFDSIDGEGKRTGYMATFVRFAGCNVAVWAPASRAFVT